jgi:hypothetical protein
MELVKKTVLPVHSFIINNAQIMKSFSSKLSMEDLNLILARPFDLFRILLFKGNFFLFD